MTPTSIKRSSLPSTTNKMLVAGPSETLVFDELIEGLDVLHLLDREHIHVQCLDPLSQLLRRRRLLLL